MTSGPYPDPDLRDPNEETPRPAAKSKRGVAQLVRRGRFNAGWCDVIATLTGTLTEEQDALLQRRYRQLIGDDDVG